MLGYAAEESMNKRRQSNAGVRGGQGTSKDSEQLEH